MTKTLIYKAIIAQNPAWGKKAFAESRIDNPMWKFATPFHAFDSVRRRSPKRFGVGVTTDTHLGGDLRWVSLPAEKIASLDAQGIEGVDVAFFNLGGREWPALLGALGMLEAGRLRAGVVWAGREWQLAGASEYLSGLDVFLYGPDGQLTHDTLSGDEADGWVSFVSHSWPRQDAPTLLL